jgi:hypothetical protein
MSRADFSSSAPSEQESDAHRLTFVRLDEIARLADLASSYWRSIALAADRGDTLTVVVHCKQVAAVTRQAFAIVKTLGETEAVT